MNNSTINPHNLFYLKQAAAISRWLFTNSQEHLGRVFRATLISMWAKFFKANHKRKILEWNFKSNPGNNNKNKFEMHLIAFGFHYAGDKGPCSRTS